MAGAAPRAARGGVDLITLLVAPEALAEAEVEVTGAAHHHLVRVRRARLGEAVRAVDGAGRARFGRVAAIGRTEAKVLLGGEAPANEPARRVELFVAPPRPERAAWLVEKATELGVAAVRFLACERDPRRIGEAQLDRLRRVAASALEQCGRSRLPELSGLHRLDELPMRLPAFAERWLLDPQGEGSPSSAPASLAILIGPEGGFAAGERERLAALATPVALGTRLLRVETAALAALALALSSDEIR